MHIESFSNFVINDDKTYWDEWNFYSENKCLIDAATELAKQFPVNETFVLCSLSKSGLPLATVLSLILRKPLLIFALGEFFSPEGLPFINVVGGSEYKYQPWYFIDSHIHSGQTALLAESGIKFEYAATVKRCYVIADCREKTASNFPLEVIPLLDNKTSLSKLKDIVINKYGKSESLLSENAFWMYHDHYWLTSLPDEIGNIETNTISTQTINIPSEVRSIVLKEDDVQPYRLYLNPDIFYSYVKLITEKFKDIDIVIAGSVGGIPLAAAMCYLFSVQGLTTRFLFLGNHSTEYYVNKLRGVKKAIIVDDVVSIGSLIAIIYNKLLKPNKIELSGIACIAKTKFPSKGKYITEDVNGVPLFCAIV
jgi:adenine/guanine phosphoribosyltransferase-like PRPP-binding protein